MTWVGTQCGVEGEFTFEGMLALYSETVDKAEYPDFDCWLWDMERSGVFDRMG